MAKGGAKTSNGYFHWPYFCFIYRVVYVRCVHRLNKALSFWVKESSLLIALVEKILTKASLTPCPVLRAAKKIKILIDYRLLWDPLPFQFAALII